jgi:hypothetical protein
VRLLMLVVAVLAFLLGWMVQKAHRQQRAVAATLGTGGSVLYQSEQLNGLTANASTAPAWLRSLLGEEFFRDVVALDLRGRRVNDAALETLGGLETLQELSLWDSEFDDLGLAYLTGPIRVEELNPSEYRITDAGLKHLEGLSQLRTLWLMGAHVSDEGVKHLAKLSGLRKLTIGLSRVGDTPG